MDVQEYDRQERIATLVREVRNGDGRRVRRQDRSRSYAAKLESQRRRRIRKGIEHYGFRVA